MEEQYNTTTNDNNNNTSTSTSEDIYYSLKESLLTPCSTPGWNMDIIVPSTPEINALNAQFMEVEQGDRPVVNNNNNNNNNGSNNNASNTNMVYVNGNTVLTQHPTHYKYNVVRRKQNPVFETGANPNDLQRYRSMGLEGLENLFICDFYQPNVQLSTQDMISNLEGVRINVVKDPSKAKYKRSQTRLSDVRDLLSFRQLSEKDYRFLNDSQGKENNPRPHPPSSNVVQESLEQRKINRVKTLFEEGGSTFCFGSVEKHIMGCGMIVCITEGQMHMKATGARKAKKNASDSLYVLSTNKIKKRGGGNGSPSNKKTDGNTNNAGTDKKDKQYFLDDEHYIVDPTTLCSSISSDGTSKHSSGSKFLHLCIAVTLYARMLDENGQYIRGQNEHGEKIDQWYPFGVIIYPTTEALQQLRSGCYDIRMVAKDIPIPSNITPIVDDPSCTIDLHHPPRNTQDRICNPINVNHFVTMAKRKNVMERTDRRLPILVDVQQKVKCFSTKTGENNDNLEAILYGNYIVQWALKTVFRYPANRVAQNIKIPENAMTYQEYLAFLETKQQSSKSGQKNQRSSNSNVVIVDDAPQPPVVNKTVKPTSVAKAKKASPKKKKKQRQQKRKSSSITTTTIAKIGRRRVQHDDDGDDDYVADSQEEDVGDDEIFNHHQPSSPEIIPPTPSPPQHLECYAWIDDDEDVLESGYIPTPRSNIGTPGIFTDDVGSIEATEPVRVAVQQPKKVKHRTQDIDVVVVDDAQKNTHRNVIDDSDVSVFDLDLIYPETKRRQGCSPSADDGNTTVLSMSYQVMSSTSVSQPPKDLDTFFNTVIVENSHVNLLDYSSLFDSDSFAAFLNDPNTIGVSTPTPASYISFNDDGTSVNDSDIDNIRAFLKSDTIPTPVSDKQKSHNSNQVDAAKYFS